ncbi:MAG: CopG family transcriptional regulator [bacterium]|nr:CopG family transcriptional regulator [bacterium]
MRTLQIELPDRLAEQLEDLVRAGWFVTEAELARQALTDFVHHHRFQLQEQFHREDIQWALSLKESKA